jgi:homoserine O-succinyltransferase/O-acetyltransferase
MVSTSRFPPLLLINRSVRDGLLNSNAGRGTRGGLDSDITIGLVNIMPPAAMHKTERQFSNLLSLAAQRQKIRLKFFAVLDRCPENVVISQAVHGYEDISKLWGSELDGLIVTGTEPKAASMIDEEIWPMLAKLIDWASENTISSIWSCFAAHAAVFRLDGIQRGPFVEKLSGIFECVKTTNHRIVSKAPARWLVPHSRYNTLNEDELHDYGYHILSRSPRTGADIFVKQCVRSQFVFFQGHLEYDTDTLYGEYCRDVKRYLNGRRATYPNPPEGYLNGEIVSALQHPWQEAARQIYAGWLSYIAHQKRQPREQGYMPYIRQAGE